MRRRGSFRGWAVLWAVLQFALPAAVSYADALLERSAVVAAQIHVESQTTRDCAPVHPTECGLCQVLSRAGLASRNVEVPSLAAVLSPAPQEQVAPVGQRGIGRSPLPRAPPLA